MTNVSDLDYNCHMSETANITTRMDVDLIDRLDQLAGKCGTTRSDMMHRIVANTITEYETLVEVAAESPLARVVAKLTALVISSKAEREELDRLLEALQAHRREHDPNQMTLKVDLSE